MGKVKGAEPLPVGWLGYSKKKYKKIHTHTHISSTHKHTWRGRYPVVFTGSVSYRKAFDLQHKDGVVKLDEVAALLAA